MLTLDWQGVLSGQPLQWVISGFLTTLWVTLAGVLLSTLLAIILLALRLSGNAFGRRLVAAWVSLFRNTPLLVQLMFWYFAAWNFLPRGVIDFVNTDHFWSILPGDVWWLTPEFLCSAWGWGYSHRPSWLRRSLRGCRRYPPGSERPRYRKVFRVDDPPPYSAPPGAGKRLATHRGAIP